MKNQSKILILIISITVSKISFSQTANEIEKTYYDKVIYKEIPNKQLFEILSSNEIERPQKKSL